MNSASNSQGLKASASSNLVGLRRGARAETGAGTSREKLDNAFSRVGQKLREGLSGEAEKVLIEAIEARGHDPNDLANLKRLLSFTLETLGRYKESLDILKPYEDASALAQLNHETQIRVT